MSIPRREGRREAERLEAFSGILVRTIIRTNGPDSAVAAAVGSDVKGNASMALYILAIGLAWVSPWIAYALFLAVAVVWFVPDRRFTRSASQA